MFTAFAICLAILAILMVIFARHLLPKTWIAFVILSAILTAITGNYGPHIASPWPAIAGGIWLGTAVIVLEAREIRSRRAIIAMIIMIAALIGIAMFAPKIIGFPLQDKPSPSIPAITTPTHTTWKMGPSDYGNNRWFANGIAEIKNSKTDAEAASAANAWLEKVKLDPNLLAGAAKYLLNSDVDKTTLSDKDGWATDKAVQLVAELELTLGQAKITATNAPSTGYNSGVENNNVVGSSTAGVNGDTKAIQVTLPDGKVIWVMGRCGNVVTKGSPPVPPGKTDQPPIVTPTPTPPATTVIPTSPISPVTIYPGGGGDNYHPPVVAKDPSQDPVAKGNAPVGGGSNQDPSPGVYNPPGSGPAAVTQPSAAPRVNPVVTTAPATVTPDPASAPAAEAAAPTPAAPAKGYSAPPGGK